MDDFLRLISCPITKKIFYIPVIASDDNVYEAEKVIELITNKIASPITNKILEDDIRVVIPLKFMISSFLDNLDNISYKERQYVQTYDVNSTYFFSKDEINKIFSDRMEYNKLTKYSYFKIEDIDRYAFKDFLKEAATEVIIHFIDYCNDLEYDWSGSWKIINYVTKICNCEIIRHLIDKNIDLEHPCTNDWRPIHYVALLHDGETTRKLVSKGVNLMAQLSDGETALDIIVIGHDKETINFTLEYVINITESMMVKLLVDLDDNTKLTDDDKDLIKCQIVSKMV